MLPCEYCKNFKNTYFEEYLRPAASEKVFFRISQNSQESTCARDSF